MKGNKSESIQIPKKTEPGDGVLVDQIVSDQPGQILQMSVFITIQNLWGCTTFVYHVSDYVYVHLMRDLPLSAIMLAKKAFGKTDGAIQVNRQALSR